MIDGQIDAHAQAAGRMVVHDLAGGGAKRNRVLGIDAALDGMAVEFDVALRDFEAASSGHADLFEHEIDVGDHLGDRMLDLDARVHLDEVELSVLIEELDRSNSEIFELAHRVCRRLSHRAACRLVEGGAGAFLPDFLITALQRTVALAEMDGATIAIAEHLNLDMTGTRKIFFEVESIIAERGLGLGARGCERDGELFGCVGDFHAAPAPTGGGLDQQRKADRPRERNRFLIG